MIIVQIDEMIEMDSKDIKVPIIFLVTLLILNIIRWGVYKFTSLNEPRYMYWYLFVVSTCIAHYIGGAFYS